MLLVLLCYGLPSEAIQLLDLQSGITQAVTVCWFLTIGLAPSTNVSQSIQIAVPREQEINVSLMIEFSL